jgi:hypothetical protein
VEIHASPEVAEEAIGNRISHWSPTAFKTASNRLRALIVERSHATSARIFESEWRFSEKIVPIERNDNLKTAHLVWWPGSSFASALLSGEFWTKPHQNHGF